MAGVNVQTVDYVIATRHQYFTYGKFPTYTVTPVASSMIDLPLMSISTSEYYIVTWFPVNNNHAI
jgi:hypothetical protein